LADEESKKFTNFCTTTHQPADAIEFNVTILTTSYWPTYKTFEITIPKEIESSIKTFNLYYQQKYNHRILKWCYSLGSATISAKFSKSDKQYDLLTGTY